MNDTPIAMPYPYGFTEITFKDMVKEIADANKIGRASCRERV